MILGSINIAYPYKKVRVRAHRKLTVIEWLILETISKGSTKKGYESMTLNQVFEEIFQIHDSDLLIKPCLINLQKLNVLRGQALYEDTSLKEVRIFDFRLTEDGSLMLKKGLLPSKKNENSIVAFYDIYNKKILDKLKVGDEKPLGIPVLNIEDESQVIVPSNLIKESLDSKKYKEKYKWLKGATDIIDVENEDLALFWLKTTKEIEILDDGFVRLSNIQDEKLNSILFNKENESEYSKELKDINVKDFDDELSEIFFINELDSKRDKSIDKAINQNNGNGIVGFLDKRFTQEGFNTKKLRGLVLFNSDEFSIKIVDKQIQVNLPKGIINDECAIFLGKESIFVGKANVYNDFGNGKFNVGYKKKQVNLSQSKVIEKVIKEYRELDYRIIVLAASISQDLVLQNLMPIVKSNKDSLDKLNIVKEIKTLSKKIFGEKVDISNIVKEIIRE